MSVQASAIINMALTFLALPANAISAGLPLGTGEYDDSEPMAGFEITPDTQALLWLSEAQNKLARLCVPFPDSASVAATSAGQQVFPYSAIQSTSQRTLFKPDGVLIGTTPLTQRDLSYLKQAGGYWCPPTASGNPEYWADSNNALRLPPNYTSTPTLTITGYFLPAALTSDSQTLDPLLDDLSQEMMAHYLATKIAYKNADVPTLGSRAAAESALWMQGVSDIYDRLIEGDSSMGGFFSPVKSNSAMVQISKPVNAQT